MLFGSVTLAMSENVFQESFVLSCSEFGREVRHVDECWYLLVHLSGFCEHEKQSAAAKS